MRSPFALNLVLCGALSVLCTRAASAQQDVLWYSFEKKTGLVDNRAAGPKRGPATAKIVSTNKGADRVEGFQKDAKNGGGDYALASFDDWDKATRLAKNANYLDTGWTAGLSGSITLAFFVRYGVVTEPGGAQYVFGGDDGFRCFTEGRAKTGLSVAGWGGFGYVDLNWDLRAASVNNWVHVALVFDDAKRVARWYIDGKLVETVPIFGPIKIASRKQGFRIGAHDTLISPNVWHLDEFRLAEGALSEEEIAVWRYESGSRGDGCRATLRAATGARPIIGGPAYTLEARGQPSALAIVAFGLSSKKLGTIDLPLDLGDFIGDALDNCSWYTSSEILFTSAADATGLLKLPIPMPTDPGLSGFPLWAQALLTWDDKGKRRWQSTNAWRMVFVPR